MLVNVPLTTCSPVGVLYVATRLPVIIPPLINQHLNLTKNTSLAIAVGYPDLFSIGLTINNQTGQAIEGFLIIMLVYLTISLTISVFMSAYNRRVALRGNAV